MKIAEIFQKTGLNELIEVDKNLEKLLYLILNYSRTTFNILKEVQTEKINLQPLTTFQNEDLENQKLIDLVSNFAQHKRLSRTQEHLNIEYLRILHGISSRCDDFQRRLKNELPQMKELLTIQRQLIVSIMHHIKDMTDA